VVLALISAAGVVEEAGDELGEAEDVEVAPFVVEACAVAAAIAVVFMVMFMLIFVCCEFM
jgi:hypothetical protein